MALIHCNFISQALRKQTAVTVVIPTYELSFDGWDLQEAPPMTGQEKFRTLYLYHGWSDDSTCWQRFTNIERYAQQHQMAVVMPDAEHSYYVDMAQGNRFGQYLYEELPTLMRALFPLSEKREDTFVAGLSMGGYGALYAALAHPQLFSAAASLSGVTDIVAAVHHPDDYYSHYEYVFGDLSQVAGSGYDLHALLGARKAEGGPLPRLFLTCGDLDTELLHSGKQFAGLARAQGFDVTETVGQGAHEWPVWDAAIQEVLDWLDR